MDFERFFQMASEILPGRERVERVAKASVEEASEMIAFSQITGYKRLTAWLEKEIDRPVPTRPEVAEMVAGITRQTTLREVRDQMRRWISDAEVTLSANREGNNG